MEAGALRKLIYNSTKDTSGGPVDIVNANNEFKSTYEILLDISRVWKDLDDMTKATLLEKIAGKHRASVVSALLNDTKTLEEAYADALQSAGSASEEFEKRTKSIEYHLQQLYAAWQELATNTATVEFINGIIDSLRTLVEVINSFGVGNVSAVLTGLFGGFGWLFKLKPMLEGLGAKSQEEGEKIQFLGKSFVKLSEILDGAGLKKGAEIIKKFTGEFDLFTGKSKAIAGAIKIIVTALTSLGKSIPFGIIATIGFTAATGILNKLDEWKNRASTALDETKTLENQVKNLQAEFELLSGKETLTDVEKERLSILEDEIALQEADLKLSKQRLAEINSDKYTHIKTTKPLFGESTKVIDQSQTADELLAENIGDATGNYAEAKATISELREERKKYSEQLKNSTSGEREYQEALVKLSSINKQLISENEKLTNSQNSIKTNYDNLLVQEEELVNITENSVGLTDDEIDAYKEKLNMTRSDIELHKILLGLEDANQEYAKEQLAAYESYKTASNIITKLNDGHSITKEELEALKKEYPNLTGVTEEYGEGAEASYTISKEALETLAETQATSLSQMNNNEIARTIAARDEALNRIRIYKMEMSAIAQVAAAQGMISDVGQQLDAEADQSGSMMDRLKWAAYMTQTAEASNISSMISGTITATQNQLDTANAELNALEQALKDFAAGKNPLDNGDGDPQGDGKGPGSGDGDKTDLWDKYANAIEKITQKLEQYDKAIESTESALDLNQSYEERSLELMSEEYDLYGDLIEQYTNKSVAQQEALAATNELIAEMYARLKELTGVDMSNMTQAEMDEWLNTNLSKKDLDSTRGQEIKQIIDALATALDTQHDWNMQVDETKSKLNELNRSQVNIRINFQNDATEKFEESRESAEKVLDILEEIEGTEQRRIDLLDALNDSYETEFAQNLKMYDETIKDLQGMEKGSDAYNDTLKEAHRLEMRNLEIIQEQLDAQLRQIDAERQLALQRNESLVYGEQGKDAWEKSREREIDRLNDQLEALEEDTSEADYLEQLAEKEEHIAELEEKLANLRNQKTIQQLKQQEDGSFQWEYVEDQRAINETMEELEDARNDLQKTKDDKALQDRKDAIQDEIDAMEDEISERAERLEIMNEQDEEYYAEQERMAQENAEANINILEDRIARTSQALNTLENRTRTGLREVDAQTEAGLKNLSDTYSEWLGAMSVGISSWVEQIIEEFNRLEAAQRAAAEEAASMVPGGGSSSSPPPAAGGIKFVEANNFLARLHYGERVLTRQEASQYNELEDDIKSGKLQSYFDSLQEDAALSISNVAATTVAKSATVPTVGSAVTSFVIEHLELPQVKDPTDFAAVINEWARGEFGGLAQKARIIPAR